MAKEYYVSVQDDTLAPEETLFDAGSQFSDLERPIPPSTFRLVFWSVLGLMLVIGAVSFKFGVFDHAGYAALVTQNRSSNFSAPAPRGIITDSSGKPLVQNIPSFDLVAVSKEIKPVMKDPSQLAPVAKALNISLDELIKNINGQLNQASVFSIATDMTKDQVLAVQYANPTGLYIVPDAKRQYIDGPVFSQLVGYIGKVNKDDLAKDPYYLLTDSTGRLGIESEYEKYLRGDHGRIFFGDATSSSNVDAVTGDSVSLNIDGDLQREVYTAAKNILAEAGLSRGAAVIQNPQTGQVLAMVSFPSFDNNQFVGGLSQAEYESLFNNPAKPLFNRVISGLYNPGSTIKPLMGLMGLQEKVVTPNTTIQDCVSITIPNPYDKTVSYTYHNWRTDYGPFDLRRAIAQSCDVYFYTLGGGYGPIKGLGADKIDQYLTQTLANHDLGIDLAGEDHGFVPSPDWKQSTRGEPWYQGDTYNISIGQGDLLVTPLWLNTILSGIANGGTLWQPEVAKGVSDANGAAVKSINPQTIGKLPFSAANLAEVKSDMEETVISGTAGLLKDLPVQVAAKTGTAEVVKHQSINSLFTVFGPTKNPQIAMTVLVEGSASNQGYAIRIANEVLKWYFARTASASQ